MTDGVIQRETETDPCLLACLFVHLGLYFSSLHFLRLFAIYRCLIHSPSVLFPSPSSYPLYISTFLLFLPLYTDPLPCQRLISHPFTFLLFDHHSSLHPLPPSQQGNPIHPTLPWTEFNQSRLENCLAFNFSPKRPILPLLTNVYLY